MHDDAWPYGGHNQPEWSEHGPIKLALDVAVGVPAGVAGLALHLGIEAAHRALVRPLLKLAGHCLDQVALHQLGVVARSGGMLGMLQAGAR